MKDTRLDGFMEKLRKRGIPFNPSIMIDFNIALNRMRNQSRDNVKVTVFSGKSIKIEFIEKEIIEPEGDPK